MVERKLLAAPVLDPFGGRRVIPRGKGDLRISERPEGLPQRDLAIGAQAVQVVLDAVFPYARDYWAYPDLVQKGIMPHTVKEIWLGAPEDKEINFRSDITDTYDLKLKALRCHKSQIKESFSSEMEKWLCTRAKDMADGEDFKLAEGFHRVEIWW